MMFQRENKLKLWTPRFYSLLFMSLHQQKENVSFFKIAVLLVSKLLSWVSRENSKTYACDDNLKLRRLFICACLIILCFRCVLENKGNVYSNPTVKKYIWISRLYTCEKKKAFVKYEFLQKCLVRNERKFTK